MKKKIIAILLVLALMFAEYCYLTNTFKPYCEDDGFFRIEISWHSDSYSDAPVFETEE